MRAGQDFVLAVITKPVCWAGEVSCLEALLEAGVQKLHIRKPGIEVRELLERLAPRWAARLVWHGDPEVALRYGIPQVHGAAGHGLMRSVSVHSWEEFKALPQGLAYAFISPVFDSISKPGYGANAELLRRPMEGLPCRAVGLGGVNAETIRALVRHGWEGAAVLGWIWEQPGEEVARLEQLKKIIDE